MRLIEQVRFFAHRGWKWLEEPVWRKEWFKTERSVEPIPLLSLDPFVRYFTSRCISRGLQMYHRWSSWEWESGTKEEHRKWGPLPGYPKNWSKGSVRMLAVSWCKGHVFVTNVTKHLQKTCFLTVHPVEAWVPNDCDQQRCQGSSLATPDMFDQRDPSATQTSPEIIAGGFLGVAHDLSISMRFLLTKTIHWGYPHDSVNPKSLVITLNHHESSIFSLGFPL